MHRTLIIIIISTVLLICGCSNNQKSDTTVLTPGITDDSQEAITNYLSEDPERQTDCWWFPVSKPGADPSKGSAPLSVHFFDNGSYSPKGYPIVKWFWKFQKTDKWWEGWKDCTSTKGDTQYVYEQPGNYTATLLVIDKRHFIGLGHINITVTELLPNPRWTRTWGGSDWYSGLGVATDGLGNVYVTGYFQGTVDFDPGLGEDNHTSNGNSDVFLSKFDPTGTFLWAKTWGGSSADGYFGCSVATDQSGNVYVTGNFYGTADFDPGSGEDWHTSSTSASGDDVFLSKFDPTGTFLWAKTWGDYSCGVITDQSGNVYVTGSFRGTVDFDPGIGEDWHISNGGLDAFLNKFDSSGTFQWTKTWGGSVWDDGSGVAVDGSGNVYVTGSFTGTVDFDPGSGEDWHTSNNVYSFVNASFLSKFDSLGAFLWAKTWGGGSMGGYGYGHGVAVNTLGNVYVIGMFNGTVDFDPGSGEDWHTSGYNWNAFLSKFDPTGTFLWAKTWGGSYNDGRGVATDGSGNVYVIGMFNGTVDFDPGSGEDWHTSNGTFDAFLSKLDSSGNFEWAKTWGGSDDDAGCGVAVDGSGNIYITGFFQGTVDFDPGLGVDWHTSNGDYDVFLSKFPPE